MATLVAVLAPGVSAQALTPATTPLARIVPKVTMATAYNFGGTALDISIAAPSCVDFTGGRTILNKELSSLKVPRGFVVVLFEHFGCTGASFVTLTSGDYPNLSNISGPTGPVNFNDMASSFIAVPQ